MCTSSPSLRYACYSSSYFSLDLLEIRIPLLLSNNPILIPIYKPQLFRKSRPLIYLWTFLIILLCLHPWFFSYDYLVFHLNTCLLLLLILQTQFIGKLDSSYTWRRTFSSYQYFILTFSDVKPPTFPSKLPSRPHHPPASISQHGGLPLLDANFSQSPSSVFILSSS